MGLSVFPNWPPMYLDAKRRDDRQPADGDLLYRASTESQVALCPARVETPTVASERMFFGTVQHALIEGALAGAPLPDPSDVMRIADDLLQWDRPGETIADLMGEHLGNWLGEQLSMLVAWSVWFEQQTDLRIIETEVSMIAPIIPHPMIVSSYGVEVGRPAGAQVWLGGTPDAIAEHLPTGGLIGLDWKTSGSMWKQKKADGSRQDDAYAWLYEYIQGRFIEDWWFVVGDRNQGLWQALATKATRLSADSTIHTIERQMRMLTSGLPLIHTPNDGFGGRGWHCKPEYCGNWNACGGRRLGDEFDDLTREGNGW